jgi:sarcosine oxidase, subunit alpha
MTQNNSNRLSAGGRIDRSKPLRFSFNGKSYAGFAGDTLASALLANGVQLVARSWKYHRPRGLMAAGVEEPNGLVQLFEGARTVPNAKMTEVSLVDGLVASSIHASPSIEFDLRAANGWFARLIPAGFYYKTFMASQKAWHFFEKHIRKASGLGDSPMLSDPDVYDKQNAHADVLIVGGGVAGLSAALAAGKRGARVILCDEQADLGGWLLSSHEQLEGKDAAAWLACALDDLAKMPNVQLLPRTTAFGFQDHRLVTLMERRTDHLARTEAPAMYRERLWKVRAKQVILATGAHERPLVFAGNDIPSVMLSGAVVTYLHRYAVRLGQQACVFTNNDAGYEAALALHAAGVAVQVVDARSEAAGPLSAQAKSLGIPVRTGYVVTQAHAGKQLRSISVQAINAQGELTGAAGQESCDLLAVSGGYSPVIHLQCQAGSKANWSEAHQAFLPGPAAQGEISAGACAGAFEIQAAMMQGAAAGELKPLSSNAPDYVPSVGWIKPLWLVPHAKPASRAPKQFVDFQNDVTAADILLAVREGFESIEHVKRYTAMGFGTDQGKTGNINGMGIVAQALGKSIPQVGTTTFRPNYTPITFGALAGLELGDAFDPVRTTPVHAWHVQQGALFEDVGQWKRPWYFPKSGEDIHAAVHRETLAVRNHVGTLDASTLGKIDIRGPDAADFLNWVYCNAWSKLEVGKCRYGLMLDENGMVFDDGVAVRLAQDHFLMHTTTGGAARVMAWLERWHQTEWPHMKVFFTSVTDQWATTAVVGPKARELLQRLCTDVDWDGAAFPFMAYRQGTVAGIPARIMRISFSGELSYEVSVPAGQGLVAWKAIHAAGQDLGITPYGTETMHVLRAEKGFIIVGQDTDGSITPIDLGMGGMVAKTKDFLGKRSLTRSDTTRADRKQLVGLLTQDAKEVLPEGAQILNTPAPSNAPTAAQPVPIFGHVTSSYFSPTLQRSVALALVKSGASRMGETIYVATKEGRSLPATISSPVFFDASGERQHA